MITVIICFLILMGLFGIGLKLTGAIVKALLWIFILFPVGTFLWTLALLCCCTLVLIPLGIVLFKTGLKLMLSVIA